MTKGSPDRRAKVAKAGKRSNAYQTPPPINNEKQDRRDNGMQQFVATKQLTAKREVEFVTYDKSSKQFVRRIKTITVPVDFIIDVTRGRAVKSPVKERQK